jgi:hypothetical protein
LRKKLFLVVALLATAGATLTAPKQAEAVTCSWECGPCGLICPCDTCKGPVPFCNCISD